MLLDFYKVERVLFFKDFPFDFQKVKRELLSSLCQLTFIKSKEICCQALLLDFYKIERRLSSSTCCSTFTFETFVIMSTNFFRTSNYQTNFFRPQIVSCPLKIFGLIKRVYGDIEISQENWKQSDIKHTGLSIQ